MKIIQINAWLGRLNSPLARFVSDQQADIICIQEALKPQIEGPVLFGDQFDFISELKSAGNYTHEFFAAAYSFPLAGNLVDEGNVILSKFPLTNQFSVHTHQHYHVRDNADSFLPNTRILQSCLVQIPDGKTLSLLNYQGHLEEPKGQGNEVTIETMKKVRDEVKKMANPIIFCGDLNVWPSSPALDVLNDLKLRNLTVENDVKGTLSTAHRAPKADLATATCDYILISPEINVKDFRVSEEVVSDHKALILEFEL